MTHQGLMNGTQPTMGTAYSEMEKYIIWTLVNVVAIIIARYSTVPIYLGKHSKNSWLNKILDLKINPKTGESYIQIPHHTFYAERRFFLYRNILIASSLMFYYGLARDKYFKNPHQDCHYLLITYLTTSLYGLIFEIRGLNCAVTPSEFPYMPIQFKIWLGCVLTITLWLLKYHLNLAYQNGCLLVYLLALIASPLVYIYAYFDIVRTGSKPGWHIHHWFIGWCGSLLWCFDDPISKTAFSIYYGIFLLGASNGLSPVLYNVVDPEEEAEADYISGQIIDFDE